MNSLFARISSAFLAILLVVGGCFFLIERWSSERYYEELTQRLNGAIAMYVTGETSLINNGQVNRDELTVLAQRAMVINPTVEIYLLDPNGQIIDHGLPNETQITTHVDLGPIGTLMDGEEPMPIRGTDPRSNQPKVFSVAEVRTGAVLEGYLYAVLGGQKYEALANTIKGSYVRTTSISSVIAVVISALLVGLLVFALLTRRLSCLTTRVLRFTASNFDPSSAPTASQSGNRTDEIGQLDGAFAVMAEKIAEQFSALKETDRLRRELISNVSHDLRTPLSSMQGYVDTLLIKDERLSKEQRQHYLRIARVHTRRLSRMIGDLFELSKLESAAIHPKLETFSLAELMHDVCQQFELDAQRSQIQLTADTGTGQQLVYADIGLVQRVLENLIRNALKFTPAGGQVRLNVSDQPQRVAVAITDTGCGIEANEIDQIFDRLHRSHRSDDKTGDSSGLGLAIVKRILDLHGSRITVQSKPNAGTRFEFALRAA
ncbi:MAG: two-component sensor histidine kinase [Lysobacteraceae bacterium]|nr:MAG: two-component sensor histidine kinase [Xanthomonadaceae bacterium]